MSSPISSDNARVARASTPVTEMNVRDWHETLDAAGQALALSTVERGGVLYFPRLAFGLAPEERYLLSPAWSDSKAKNISLDLTTGEVRGASASADDLARLAAMIGRFSACARSLIERLFPSYGQAPVVARTSFRTVPAQNRASAWRKDDRLLHVDAFPSRPNGGERILRVFTNVNPLGEPRIWHVGESFEALAARFLPAIAPPLPGAARVLSALGVTKGRRSAYDHIMLKLHDSMKADAAYQRDVQQAEFAFLAGSTWVCFSDQVSHAVLRGQYMLEQTLMLPLNAMCDPDRAPLRVLERLAGRILA